MPRPRLGILLSGRGSNFLALRDAIADGRLEAEIAVVVSNVGEAPGLARARESGLATVALPHRGMRRRVHEEAVLETLRDHDVDWVCLAGYMRILGPTLIDAYPQRIVNIHPSLLPAFPGLDAQAQAWEYGVCVSGCTVHLVDMGMDTGPVVDQIAVTTAGVESARGLAERILEQEHVLYPRALGKLLGREWRVEGRRLVFL